MFTSIPTKRLVIRPFVEDDAPALHARRNDPAVAEYLTYALPFSMERATRLVADSIALDGPRDGEVWLAAVAERETGRVVGDVSVELSWGGRTAEIGYVFDTDGWGHGYAAEAAAALVDYLFEERGVTRVFGMLHPDNPASAMVLERVGMIFEGHTRSSFWVGDVCSDDWIYGMTRADWDTWRQRPRGEPSDVALVEIGPDNVGQVAALRTHKSQERFVAPMAGSFADALFPEEVDGGPLVPWMRAVIADGETVGFVMLALTTEHNPDPYLWRLLVDRLHQRRGIGRRILALVEEECRNRGDRTLYTSWESGKGSPADFYLAYGFDPTGELIDGEVEARKDL